MSTNRIVIKSALVGILCGIAAAIVTAYLVGASSRGDDLDKVIRFIVIGFVIGEAAGFLLTFFYMRKRQAQRDTE
jgi:F0F1-type ATP synthase membrane subunit c/vacuolar-type H+-ATPase subunit K